MDIYQENILDHSRNPRNYGKLENAQNAIELNNPSCGDTIEMQAVVENDTIKEIAFTGAGCAISQASASMLTEDVLGKNVQEVLGYDRDTIINLLGVNLGPTRIKCALLSLETLHKILKSK